MSDQPSESKKPPQVATTLFLKKLAPIDLVRLQKATGSLLATSDIESADHPSDDPNRPLFLPAGGGVIMTMPMPFPYPASLQQPAQFAHWWPSAEKDIASCTSHLMVSCSWARFSRAEAHVRHTRLIAGLLAQLPAVGVLWGSSLMQTDLVCKMAANMVAGQGMPVQLWVLIQFSRQQNGNSLISTVGMRDFGHMEIETDCAKPLQETYGVVLQFANWLIDQQAPVQDGFKYQYAPDASLIARQRKSFRPNAPSQVCWLDFNEATRH